MSEPALEIKGLTVALPAGSDRPFALEGLDLSVHPGEIVCLVGESGSGKSLCAGAVMRLLPEPSVHVAAGTVRFLGDDLLTKTEREMRAIRGRDIAMIFQEPMTALNPQKTTGWQLDEVLRLHTGLKRSARRARALEMLERVQLPDPPSAYNAYPHQISGGQRQRVMIAMALLLSPKLIIADEPTTALDVTTQLQILKLIRELQAQEGAGVLFITHDFGVVAEIADRVAVLRKGELVEQGPADTDPQRPAAPLHPGADHRGTGADAPAAQTRVTGAGGPARRRPDQDLRRTRRAADRPARGCRRGQGPLLPAPRG